jgi:hypothetical protein
MADGACAHPILPCVPVRSMRAVRGQFVRWAVVATIGFLALVIGSRDLSLLMPGPLTQAHSGLGVCRSCHSTVGNGWTGWIHAAFAPSSGRSDSARCLECHMAGKDALRPHGVAPTDLAVLTRRIGDHASGQSRPAMAALRAAAFPTGPETTGMLPCATCHIEHRGERADLAAVGETQCQACHVVQFSRFSSGHPAFDDYPYRRRTRIIFDHMEHFARHFPEIEAKRDAARRPPAACIDCHVPGSDGRLMGTRSFDQTCSRCHLGQIRGFERAMGPRGIAVLAVPGLDVQTLRQRNIGIGQWPEYAEARFTSIMTLLLSGDRDARAALDATAALDLLDLRSATDDQLAAVARLAWAVKSLFRELSTDGMKKFRERLVAATGRPPDDALLARLMVAIPRDVLLGARRDWFPDLDTELADHAAGKPVPIPGGTRDSTAAAPPPAGTGDRADILAPPGDQGDILAGPAPPKDQGDILVAPGDRGDILVAPKDQGDILAGPAAPTDQGDILSGAATGTDDAAKAESSPLPEPPTPVNEEDFVRLGGWYRQDFRLLFHPTGHADPFLRAWLDYSGSLHGSSGENFAARVFEAFTAKEAQGQCAKCHSVERAAAGGLAVNWHPAGADRDAGGFTKFSHAPHMRTASDSGCLACHQVDREAKYPDAYAGTDPHRRASNFRPMERAACSRCHSEKLAGEGCLLCHSYHATPIRTPLMATKVSAALPAVVSPEVV